MTFADYVSRIDQFDEGTFDAVLVDGRARSACLLRAWPKIRKGGVLVLDNSERPRYLVAINRLPSQGRFDYVGPAAYSRWYWQTTVWER